MKLRSILLLAGIVFVLSACSLSDDITPPPGYQSPVPQPTAGPVFPANPPDMVAGTAIFIEKCAPCHGGSGMGDGPQAAKLPKKPTALGELAISRAASPAAWYKVVTEGRMDTFMPPFTSLTDQQRWDVVAYALTLPDMGFTGQNIYMNNCMRCHGDDGKQSAKSDFSDQARMAQLSLNDIVAVINDGVGDMPAFAGKLNEDQQFAVAAYLRTLTHASAKGLTPPPAAASAAVSTPALIPQGEGVISGKIVNKSGTGLPANLPVVLHVFEHAAASGQFSELRTQTTILDSAGSYSFTGLAMPSNYAFYISVDYGDTTYNSEPIAPTSDVKTYDLSMDIFDTTTDLSTLVADQVHIILDYSKPDIIQVVEYYAIMNPSKKTVIAATKDGAVVTVALPKGYTNLQFQDGSLGERFILTADGFGDTFAVPPSNDPVQLVFAFDLPYSANFDFVSPFSLSVLSSEFLVSEGVKVNAPGIIDGGLQEMETTGMKYQQYGLGSYQSGDTMKVNVTGAPVKTASAPIAGTDTTSHLIIGVGTLGIVLIVVAVFLFMRGGRRSPMRAQTAPDVAKADPLDHDAIIEAIIALDDQHNAGKIAQDAYLRRRNELKAKIVNRD